jgi:hypothetical protein
MLNRQCKVPDLFRRVSDTNNLRLLHATISGQNHGQRNAVNRHFKVVGIQRDPLDQLLNEYERPVNWHDQRRGWQSQGSN